MPKLNKTIVVAEDEPDQMEYLTTILEDNGAKVFQAQNGSEVLKLAREVNPVAVTLDIQMPGTDVFEVIRQFCSDEALKNICLCVISGRPELRQFLLDKFPEGCRTFVDKPFSPEEVISALSAVICCD